MIQGKKISQLTEMTGKPADNDLLVVVDIDEPDIDKQTKKILYSLLGIDAKVPYTGATADVDLGNYKILAGWDDEFGDNNAYFKIEKFDLSGIGFGVYPMLSSHSNGVLGNLGVWQGTLAIVGESPSLTFVNSYDLSTAWITYNSYEDAITFDRSIRVASDVLAGGDIITSGNLIGNYLTSLLKIYDQNYGEDYYGQLYYNYDKTKFGLGDNAKGFLFYDYPDQDIGIWFDGGILILEGYGIFNGQETIRLNSKLGDNSQTGIVFNVQTNGLTPDNYFKFTVDNSDIMKMTPNGIYLGVNTSQKVGFFGASPITQRPHIADANGTLEDITSKFNTLLSYLEAYGLLATS